jgi:hypothetical protein
MSGWQRVGQKFSAMPARVPLRKFCESLKGMGHSHYVEERPNRT